MHKRRQLAALGFVVGAGCVLASCGNHDLVGTAPRTVRIPLPNRALLQRQPEPNCISEVSPTGSHDEGFARTSVASLDELVSTIPAVPDGRVAQSDPNVGLAYRIKLEYERDCFRHAEMRARERLLQLQRAVDATAKAIKRAQHSVP